MGSSQSIYLERRHEELFRNARTRVVSETLVDHILWNEIPLVAASLADYDMLTRTFGSNIGVPFKFHEEKYTPQQLTDVYHATMNTPGLRIDHSTQKIIKDIMFPRTTKSKNDCCIAGCVNYTLMVCGLVLLRSEHKQSATQVSVIERAKSLIAALKAMDSEITNAPLTHISGAGCCFCCSCCCERPLPVTPAMLKLATKLQLLAKIEAIFLSSLAPLTLDPIWESSDHYIDDANNAYKNVHVLFRSTLDGISNDLVSFLGSPNEKSFHKMDFSASCDSGDVNSNFEERIVANHRALTGGRSDYVPFHLLKIFELLRSKLNVIDYTMRVKTAESVRKNFAVKTSSDKSDDPPKAKLPGPIYDLFGMRLFVLDKSLFNSFSQAAFCAIQIAGWNEVVGVATSHKLKLETSYIDFKIIVKLNIPGAAVQPVAEIEILPIANYISDAVVDGHEIHKTGGRPDTHKKSGGPEQPPPIPAMDRK